MRLFIVIFIHFIIIILVQARFKRSGSSEEYKNELKPKYWIKCAMKSLFEKLTFHPNYNVAKNVIFFVGDGMSIPTITASRIYKGQKLGELGENSKLFFENFPYVGLTKTYCIDKQVADSACSATALFCGLKANYATIGVTPNVEFNDCAAAMNRSNHLGSLAYWAQKAGKGTGIVTTTRITHATPAANYASVANRGYESDADVNKRFKEHQYCQDIASQLIINKPGRNLNVILGGGRKKFIPNYEKDSSGRHGDRLDNKNLIRMWHKYKNLMNSTHEYVTNKSSLNSVDYLETEYLLGLFHSDHMSYHSDSNPEIEPSLAEMTEMAIKMLQKHKNGYYLFVEGGNIDLGHHKNDAFKALDETIEFDKAIETAVKMISLEDTLVVVTADHSHVMTMSGYPKRGEDIFGVNKRKGIKYSTLSYANGPGYHKLKNHHDYDDEDYDDESLTFRSQKYLPTETHGGEDVSVHAIGPWAHLFTGVYEQNVIPHLISFASCLGNGPTICQTKKVKRNSKKYMKKFKRKIRKENYTKY